MSSLYGFCAPGNIRVFCRCRPMSPADAGNGAKSVVEFEGDRNGEPEIVVRTGHGMRKNFKFDRAFTPASDQGECRTRSDSDRNERKLPVEGGEKWRLDESLCGAIVVWQRASEGCALVLLDSHLDCFDFRVSTVAHPVYRVSRYITLLSPPQRTCSPTRRRW